MNRLLFLLLAALAAGCAPESNHSHDAQNIYDTLERVPTKVSPDGIHYRLVKIEGRTFIATQGAYGVWTFAGPID